MPVCLFMPRFVFIGVPLVCVCRLVATRNATPQPTPMGGCFELSVEVVFSSGTIPRVRVYVSSMYTHLPLRQRARGVWSLPGSKGYFGVSKPVFPGRDCAVFSPIGWVAE